MHVLMKNLHMNSHLDADWYACRDILLHIAEVDPSSLKCIDDIARVPLHLACRSTHVTVATVQSLVEGWPESSRQNDYEGSLPIHLLCRNQVTKC
mmetsp:Transcript_11558/g.28465  ORF Transcript_11558/g.28465 Transcript_11558/m.28465 type:complete len:95 (-) Transcript_11558:260-544(-)